MRPSSNLYTPPGERRILATDIHSFVLRDGPVGGDGGGGGVGRGRGRGRGKKNF